MKYLVHMWAPRAATFLPRTRIAARVIHTESAAEKMMRAQGTLNILFLSFRIRGVRFAALLKKRSNQRITGRGVLCAGSTIKILFLFGYERSYSPFHFFKKGSNERITPKYGGEPRARNRRKPAMPWPNGPEGVLTPV